jgi:hypothetical protein
VKGSGKTDSGTGRYIPIGGGSRSRIPVSDDKRISRYAGNLGIDAGLSGKIDTLAALYAQLDSKTKRALGSDFPESVGRPDLAVLASADNAADAAAGEGLAEAEPLDEAQAASSVLEIPEAEPEEAAPRRKLVTIPLEEDELAI